MPQRNYDGPGTFKQGGGGGGGAAKAPPCRNIKFETDSEGTWMCTLVAYYDPEQERERIRREKMKAIVQSQVAWCDYDCELTGTNGGTARPVAKNKHVKGLKTATVGDGHGVKPIDPAADSRLLSTATTDAGGSKQANEGGQGKKVKRVRVWKDVDQGAEDEWWKKLGEKLGELVMGSQDCPCMPQYLKAQNCIDKWSQILTYDADVWRMCEKLRRDYASCVEYRASETFCPKLTSGRKRTRHRRFAEQTEEWWGVQHCATHCIGSFLVSPVLSGLLGGLWEAIEPELFRNKETGETPITRKEQRDDLLKYNPLGLACHRFVKRKGIDLSKPERVAGTAPSLPIRAMILSLTKQLRRGGRLSAGQRRKLEKRLSLLKQIDKGKLDRIVNRCVWCCRESVSLLHKPKPNWKV